MKFSAILPFLAVSFVVKEVSAQCHWSGTAPFCGYYCTVHENYKYGLVPQGYTIHDVFSVVEQCMQKYGHYSSRCEGFGEGCGSGCKVLLCRQ